MNLLRVDCEGRRIAIGMLDAPCAIGRGGSCPASDKHEGDGCTPIGTWPLRGLLLRPGRFAPPVGVTLPWRWTLSGDGWSDDPQDPHYNRPVRLPHRWSAETLQRDDEAYDAVVVIGHNDAPPVPGAGSAIFLHLWVEARPTEGCVAVARETMQALLPLLQPDTMIEIR
jgi:L,D-peptidoglycan transpeptidase YkuD (ErfK/YbiS/YcfS/YnhG family)